MEVREARWIVAQFMDLGEVGDSPVATAIIAAAEAIQDSLAALAESQTSQPATEKLVQVGKHLVCSSLVKGITDYPEGVILQILGNMHGLFIPGMTVQEACTVLNLESL